MNQVSEPPFEDNRCATCNAVLIHGKVTGKLLSKLEKDWENKKQQERQEKQERVNKSGLEQVITDKEKQLL